VKKLADLLPDVKLQPHQKRLADEARKEPVRKLLMHALGSGKTLTSLAAAEAHGEPYTAVVPASLRANFQKEQEKFTDESLPSTVMSYSELARGKPTSETGTVIFDECLPAGSLVDGKPIETYRPGDSVWSMNHRLGQLEKRLVLRTSRRFTSSVILIKLSDGGQFVCTPNHPIYTNRGYIPAEALVPGERLCKMGKSSESYRGGIDATTAVDLSNVWERVRNIQLPLPGTQALFEGMPQASVGKWYAESPRTLRRKNPGSDGESQSDEGRDGSTNSLQIITGSRTWAEDPWWERSRSHQTRNRSRPCSSLADERHCSHRQRIQSSETTDSLQGRCRQFHFEDSGRDRWSFAQDALQTGSRQEEDGLFTFPRVESIEVHQYGSGSRFAELCPNGLVYDLTVEKNHNFFTVGYLVHNSHRLRNPGSLQSQEALDLSERAKQLLLLSGTPIVNSPGDLAMPVSMLTGKPISPSQFESRFVGQKKVYPNIFRRLMGLESGIESVVQHENELKELLKGHIDYYDPGKSVVPVNHEDVTTTMGVEQSQLYKAMWDKLPFWLRWKLRHDFPLSRKELIRMQSFLTGPRQVGLSTLPYMKLGDPLKAFKQSPKLQEAHKRMMEHLKDPRTKALVFANFIQAGLMPYSAALTKAGIPNAVFHGGLSDIERRRLVDDYNNGNIRVALLGPSGTEGLSFRGTQLVQQLDPNWQPVRSQQAVGRGLRFDSHTDLPEDLQNVKVERFIARLPLGFKDRLLSSVGFDRSENTYAADDHLRHIEARKQLLNQKFYALLKEVGQQKT
jgi:hypothetical protein